MTFREYEFLKNIMVSLDAGKYVSSDETRRALSILIRETVDKISFKADDNDVKSG